MSLTNAKDLTKEAPRSGYEQLGGYAILARAIDKGRATINGTQGDYNFDCPVDNMLLSFTGLKGEDLKAKLATGASDEDVTEWVKTNSKVQDAEEIKKWSEHFRSDFTYSTDPQKKDWFASMCEPLGLDPMTTTLFTMLDADDKATFTK